MLRGNMMTFLSGRVIALIVLMAFQILVVRLLPVREYAVYATVFALATLMQTVVSFGIPRLIPKYVSQAGHALAHADVRRLLLWLFAVRLAGSFAVMLVAWIVMRALHMSEAFDGPLVLMAGAFILAGLVQMDADACAQALGLQKRSRLITVSEAVVRLLLVYGAAHFWGVASAADVFTISAGTAAVAGLFTLTAVFASLRAGTDGPDTQPLDRVELRAVALGAYVASLAWFTSSPAVIRLIGSHVLPLASFSGFAFAQSLVVSFQRYTPGMLLFPFVEPTVMRAYAQSGDRKQLQGALSLLTKLDVVLIGSTVVGTAAAGGALVDIMTKGKFGAYGYALPWLLFYIGTSSVYRTVQTTAIALGAARVLGNSIWLSLGWLAIAWFAGQTLGLIGLLIAPIGDALSRLLLMAWALGRTGLPHALDYPILAANILMIGLFGTLGAWLSHMVPGGVIVPVAIGCVLALVYLLAVVVLRPLRRGEVDLLSGRLPASLARLMTRFARA